MGDLVQVKRAGEVIPQVIGPDSGEARPEAEQPWRMPSELPVVRNAGRARRGGEAAIYCPNVACPGRQLEGLVHFASRGAMDIRGLSYARIEQLIGAGLVHDPADLYALTREQLLELEGYADKGADALVAAIAASKTQPLSRLLCALGIRHVGAIAAQLLAQHFGTLDALMAASADDILNVRGIGATIANGVVAYFSDPAGRALVEKLRGTGREFHRAPRRRSGRTIQRQDCRDHGHAADLEQSESNGADRGGGRTRYWLCLEIDDFLVAGEEAGSKLEKAKSLGVEIIDEAELLRRVASSATSSQ